MIRHRLAFLLALVAFVSCVGAVTLEKLSLDEMVEASTLVVRGTIRNAHSVRAGSLIVTEYRVEPSEIFKGDAGTRLNVQLPGGSVDGESQVFAGVPVLHAGEEYILFLWRGKSGNLQLVGLTQGLLRVTLEEGRAMAARPPIDGILLDRGSGLPVRDAGIRIRPREIRSAVSRARSSVTSGRSGQ